PSRYTAPPQIQIRRTTADGVVAETCARWPQTRTAALPARTVAGQSRTSSGRPSTPHGTARTGRWPVTSRGQKAAMCTTRRHWRRRLTAPAVLCLAVLANGPLPLAAQPNLEVKQVLPESVDPGAPVPLEIVLRNVGTTAAEEIVVTDVLPAGYDLRD